MRVDEYAVCDGTEIANLISTRQVSVFEVHEAARASIELVDPYIGAMADGPWPEPLAHDAKGPFGGVPFVIKDLLCYAAGVPVRSGSRMSGSGLVADHDSILMD